VYELRSYDRAGKWVRLVLKSNRQIGTDVALVCGAAGILADERGPRSPTTGSSLNLVARISNGRDRGSDGIKEPSRSEGGSVSRQESGG
jgi:hypothetical protein